MKTITLVYFDYLPSGLRIGLRKGRYNVDFVKCDDGTSYDKIDYGSEAILFLLPFTGLYDPLDLFKIIRSKANIPIFAIDHANVFKNRLLYHHYGADMYFSLPIVFIDLFRNIAFCRVSKKLPKENKLCYKDLELDLERHVAIRSGKTVELRNKEFDLIAYFIKNHGIVLSKDKILYDVWDMNASSDTTTVAAHVSFLRSKIDKGFMEKRLHTVHCIGYKLE